MILIVLFFSQLLGAVSYGIESVNLSLLSELVGIKNPRVGLVANQTSKINKESSLSYCQRKKINVTQLFVPEHGYDGKVQAGVHVKNSVEHKTGISIISLFDYAKTKEIDSSLFDNVDCILFDLQDIGMRHYTYISTLYRIMQALAKTKKVLVVCDRPNPLGCQIEGPLVARGLESFISIAPIPLKHGMTLGELALYCNRYFFHSQVQLSVLPLKKYTRKSSEYQFLAPLSPNIKSKAAIYGYSFLGLLGEIAPFDVGVGSRHAFCFLGLPENMLDTIGWKKIELILLEHGIKTSWHSYYKKVKKKKYEGFLLTIPDPEKIKTVALLENIISIARSHGITLTFAKTFDKAFGSSDFQSNNGWKDAKKIIKKGIEDFYARAEKIFLYKTFPVIKD